MSFQCKLVHEPQLCLLLVAIKIYDLFLSFLHNFDFSKMAFCRLHDEYWAVNLDSFGLDTLSNTKTSKPCIISKHNLVVHKFNILLS